MGAGTLKVGYCLLAIASLVAVGVERAEAQPVTPERFVGAWELVDWRSTDGSGNVAFPYGEDAQGQIAYTANGRMSAHLMRPPEDPSDAPPQHLSYWGRFSVQASAGTVTHHVIGTSQSNWIGSDQVRNFEFENENRLILSVGGNRLTWERVQ